MPHAEHAKLAAFGTVATPDLKVILVSGQVTSSGNSPRTSSKRIFDARSSFQRAEDAASS